MKFKTLYELAKQSLRSKKKNTRRTIFGLVFGMVIILPLVMVMVGLNFGMSKKFESKQNYINFTLFNMSDYRVELDDVDTTYDVMGGSDMGRISGSKHLKELMEYDLHNTCTVFERYSLSLDKFDYFYIDGEKLESNLGFRYYPLYMNVVDMDICDDFFPTSSIKKDVPIYVKGYDAGFEKDTKRQVVVTQRFLEKHGIDAKDIYGKNLSIKKFIREYDYFCKDYKVVGILSNELLSNQDAWDVFFKADIYFLSYDMFDENGNRIISYGDDESVVVANPYSLNINNVFGTDVDGVVTTYARFESTDMNKIIDLYKYINDRFAAQSPYIDASQTFRGLYSIYDIFDKINALLLALAIVVVIIILLNLFITVYHNVDYKSQYLAMLESMGMKEKDLVKTYVTENFIVATKANIIISVISLILGIVIKLLGDMTLNRVIQLGFTLVPVWAMIVVLILGVAFVYATTLLIAYGCAKGFTKKNITEVLNGKNQN